MLAARADPSARDDNGWTPLHFATQNWRVDLASLLLSAGAEVDAQDSNGNTPLCNAVFSSSALWSYRRSRWVVELVGGVLGHLGCELCGSWPRWSAGSRSCGSL